jgi:hypothetical protein
MPSITVHFQRNTAATDSSGSMSETGREAIDATLIVAFV